MPTTRSKAKGKKALEALPPEAGRLIPPPNGATVRMYRIGHGDCFLIAFAGETPNEPAYVLIDCGYKPGSPDYIEPTSLKVKSKDICDSIRTATGGKIDVAIITHEHQDHVNAITEANFKDIEIGETWLAWTEDSTDEIANALRKVHKDKLLGLLSARNRLSLVGAGDQVRKIDRLLAFEFGGDDDDFDAAKAATMFGATPKDPLTSSNKKSMKVFKDRAERGVQFIRPHEKIHAIPGAKDVRAFALGPPRDPEKLKSLDPEGEEGFHAGFALRSVGSFFGSAAQGESAVERAEPPFARRYRIPWDEVQHDSEHAPFFMAHYGKEGHPAGPSPMPDETPSDTGWRRIDNEWLFAAEHLALDMNDYTNNASLVLAFELGKGGKVLLFAADAQRGNWLSWSEGEWVDGEKKVTAKELLSRTVLYKVGHHGSHNATLHGQATDDYPNLSWMGKGEFGREFTAMITAVRAWAETQDGWDHPLKAIKDALLKKADGRVFQTDKDLKDMQVPPEGSAADWKAFGARARGERLFFDYEVVR